MVCVVHMVVFMITGQCLQCLEHIIDRFKSLIVSVIADNTGCLFKHFICDLNVVEVIWRPCLFVFLFVCFLSLERSIVLFIVANRMCI